VHKNKERANIGLVDPKKGSVSILRHQPRQKICAWCRHTNWA